MQQQNFVSWKICYHIIFFTVTITKSSQLTIVEFFVSQKAVQVKTAKSEQVFSQKK